MTDEPFTLHQSSHCSYGSINTSVIAPHRSDGTVLRLIHEPNSRIIFPSCLLHAFHHLRFDCALPIMSPFAFPMIFWFLTGQLVPSTAYLDKPTLLIAFTHISFADLLKMLLSFVIHLDGYFFLALIMNLNCFKTNKQKKIL